VVPVRQSEIYVFVPNSQLAAAGGGGLLLALVDAGVNSVRTSKAETAVKPLRDSLVDFNFDETLAHDLKDSLAQLSWVHTGSVHILKDVSNDGLDNALASSSAGAVLFTTTDYHLSNDADVLTITVGASLFPKDAALLAFKPGGGTPKTSIGNALYHNTLVFETSLPTGSPDRDRNIAMLSGQNGMQMRAVLKIGADKLARMLADDLQYSEGGQDVIASDGDGTFVRSPDGTLKFTAKPLY
jgi:hypothetical protein